ncbi:jg11215 [Pararge aegeria aegeria]|uniref:Jg11215 protein n=4 Tax=Pararge aegeria TaxID=116150 RepID=A0A8S4RHQ7_9NEOP|nr:jg11215 [Pararge aegeria aegeria]
MQDYIYPGLRLLRKFTIPLISLFPVLTELYQETCLIQNPYFTITDMDCWPCSSVNNVGEVFNPQPVHKQQSAPFIYKTEQKEIDLNSLKILYFKYKGLFDKESPNVLINNKYYQTPQDMFGPDVLKENLHVWKFNNFNAARILRQIIPRPKVVPKFGQSTERFIVIDSKHDKFDIPDTECNYSFLIALSGTRIIDLRPAEECKHQCKSFKMELKPPYLLWYNWWYWRPVAQTSLGNDTFIAHVGSYC